MSFYAAKFFSQLTQSLLVAGLFVVASRHADAAVGLSGVLLAGIAAALMFAFVAGAVVDRVGAARAYVGGAALRMLTPLLALLIARDLPGALLVTFAASGLIQVFGPAEMSLVRLLQPRTPAKCHALLVFLQYGGQAVGAAALAPALYFAGGTTLMFAGAAATAVLFFALALVLSRRLPAEAAPAPARQAFAFRPTLRFLAGDDRARYAVGALSLKTAVSRGVFVALPLYIRSDVGVGNIAFGALVGVGVVGAIAGLVWSSRGIGERTANETMRLGMLGMAAGALALAVLDYGVLGVATASQIGPIIRLEASLNTTYLVAMPAAFLLGLSFAGALIGARVMLTTAAPVRDQGRIFATQAMLTEAVLALPLLLTGVGVEYAGARTTLAALGISALAVIFVLETLRAGASRGRLALEQAAGASA